MAFLFLLGIGAIPLVAQHRGTLERPSQLRVVEVKEKDGQILSYRYLAPSTEVTMRGTSIAPGAHVKLKVGSRPGFVELDINRGQITGLKPASQFGVDFLTYVLWAVSVDGKAANLGEITFVDDKPISINVTTPYQTFWLMLTAEPSYAVVDPSPLVVLYSASENPGRVLAEKIEGSLFFYTHYGDYDTKPMSSDRSPNALQQAWPFLCQLPRREIEMFRFAQHDNAVAGLIAASLADAKLTKHRVENLFHIHDANDFADCA